MKIKDSFIASIVSGLLGTLAMDLSNLIMWKAKKIELTYAHLASSVIVNKFRVKRPKNYIIGQILHMITGATFGIPIYQLIKWTGRDHYLAKGTFSGLLTWGVLYDFGQRVDLFAAKAYKTKSHYSSLLHNLIYGIVTAQAVVSLTDASLLNPPLPEPESGVSGMSQTI